MPSVGVLGCRVPGHAELLKKWDRLVHFMTGQNVRRLGFWFDYDELLNHAREALWRAHRTFDPNNATGANFQTYARRVITNAFNALYHYASADMRRDKVRSVSVDDEDSPDFFLSSASVPADAKMVSDEEAARVQEAMTWLTDRERRIIRGMFWKEKTLEDLGQEIGVTRERVRQIKNIAVAKIALRVREQLATEL